MTSPADLAQRVYRLESELTVLRSEMRQVNGGLAVVEGEATAAIHAQTRLIQAVRETQVEQGAEIAALRADVAEVKAGVAQIASLLGQLIRRDESPES